MNMDERKLTYDQFKADILHWKNTHREEYNRFARLMTNGDKRQYLDICKAYSDNCLESRLNGSYVGMMTVRAILRI